ncbi:MAG: putative rane protein [Chitinophagaceae bacterium]|nr:putative rane protein [Chitinophagaceae bacterium]
MTTQQVPSVKSMNIVWIAMIGGLVSFGLVTYFALLPIQSPLAGIDPAVFYILAIVLALAGMMGSTILYKLQVRAASQVNSPSKERLMSYYMSAFLLKMALLEGPGLFSVVAGLLTHQALFLSITAGLLLLMVIAKPTELQFREDFLNGRGG